MPIGLRRRLLSFVVFVALVCGALAHGFARVTFTGVVSGTVTDLNGIPLTVSSSPGAIGVTVYDINSSPIGSTPPFPPTSGTFAISVPAGLARVATSGASGIGFQDQVYNGANCISTCVPADGSLFAVPEGGTYGIANFKLTPTTRLAGIVTDIDGHPLGGIVVQVFNSSGTLVTSTTSVASGAYLTPLQLAPGGPYFVRTNSASAGNYFDQLYSSPSNLPCGTGCNVTSGGTVMISTGRPSPPINFNLEPAGRITGKLTDPSANGVGGVTVKVFDASGTNSNGTPLLTTTSSSVAATLGNYTLGPLHAGTYFVVTSTSGGFFSQLYSGFLCVPSCNPSTGTPVMVTGGNSTVANLTLSQVATIKGTVTNTATTPISGVQVRVTDAANITIGSTTTNASGQYTITNLQAASYFVRTSNAQGYFDQVFDGVACLNCAAGTGTPVAAVAGAQTTANFVLTKGAQITGRVTDAVTSAGIANTSVRITALNGLIVNSVTTDVSGNYSTTGLPTGTFFAVAVPPTTTAYMSQAYNNLPCVPCTATQEQPIDVTAGSVTPNINFALLTGGRISGTITDAATSALLGLVVVDVLDSKGLSVTSASTSLAGAGLGTYSTAGLPDGTYFLRAHSNQNANNLSLGYIPQLYNGTACAGCDPRSGTPVVIAGGQPQSGMDFHMASGQRISGHVSATGSGQPVSGVPVVISASTGLTASRATSDASGNYTSVDGFPAGTFYASASSAQGFLSQLYNGLACAGLCVPTSGNPIVVASQNVGGIDFSLTAGGQVSGTVTNAAGGAPLSGASIQIIDGNGSVVASGISALDGTFTTTAVPAGSYFVRTRNQIGFVDQVHHAPGNAECSGCDVTAVGTAINLAAGVVSTGVDFALNVGGRVGGTVTGPGGVPLQSVQVLLFTDPSAPLASFAATATTDRLGRYVTGAGVPTGGTYLARTSNTLGFVNARYNGLACVTECSLAFATPIAVTAGSTTMGVNFALTADDDPDNDGIASSLDTSGGASNVFSDIAQGGSTTGTIVDRAGWTVNVTSAGSGGVRLTLAGSGTGSAIIQTCATGDPEEVRLFAAGDSVNVQCSNDGEGRTSVRVVSAATVVELRKTINGLTTIIQLATAQVASIGSPIIADGGNLSPIHVIIVDQFGNTVGDFNLDPGESAAANKSNGGLVTVTVISGTVNVNLDGTEQTLRPGDVASVSICTPIAIESLTASPSALGPPNHKMVTVLVSPTLSGTCGKASCQITNVTSNEPVNGLGDGDTSPDWEIGPGLTLTLRAERSGTGTGRVYTVTVRCTDEAGNVAESTVTVIVKK